MSINLNLKKSKSEQSMIVKDDAANATFTLPPSVSATAPKDVSLVLDDKIVYSFGIKKFFMPYSLAKIAKLDEEILKALIMDKVAFRFLNDKNFMKFQTMLAVCPFKPPTQYQMMEKTLALLHAKHKIIVKEKLKTQLNLTISLDVWIKISKNRIYAVLVLSGIKVKHPIDVLDLNQLFHTANNTFSALKDTLKAHLQWDQISAVVSALGTYTCTQRLTYNN
ncbi:hypothetical protein DFH28DRAFT_1125002 [Melampsora americana]|nr:hypothetical protein DFH28DRAFT_1125002 [Melampsora americana]